MSSGFLKKSRARTIALALGVGAISSFAMTGTSLAATPNAGAACQGADGKVGGRGATFQTNATRALITGYTNDVCGVVAGGGTDFGNNMLAYNYANAVSNSGTGSGAGQKATSCRTDAFAGTDIPYDQNTLNQLNGAPGTITGGCSITWAPAANPTTGPWPNANDVQANVMSFPVAGSSVAVMVNLSAAACGGTKPTALNFSANTVSKLFGGDYQTWNDPALVAENASLANCNIAISRFVRFDKSGTTQVFKNFLNNADGARSGATCDPGNSWTNLALDANNQTWPTGAGCTSLGRGASSGNPALITAMKAVDGSVGYSDLADTVGSGLVLAGVRNATDTAYTSPANGLGANCDFTTSLPGSSNADAVGLNTGDNWAFDNGTGVIHEDVTYKGSLYPICGLTFDFVFTGLNGNSGANNAISRLTANQRRTLYSYFTYVFSAAGQSKLTSQRYAALPNGWLAKLRLGFQSSF
jgi:phosphate transport system substrate-binding protein